MRRASCAYSTNIVAHIGELDKMLASFPAESWKTSAKEAVCKENRCSTDSA